MPAEQKQRAVQENEVCGPSFHHLHLSMSCAARKPGLSCTDGRRVDAEVSVGMQALTPGIGLSDC